MKILINGMSVNFELEDEKNLRELVDSIMEWSSERNLVLYELHADGENLPVDDVPPIPIDQLNEVDCIIKSRADLVFSSIEEGGAYCDRAAEFIQSFDAGSGVPEDAAVDLVSGIEWLREVLLKVLSLLQIDLDSLVYQERPVSHYLDDLEFLKERLNQGDDSGLISSLNGDEKGLFLELKNIFRMLLMSEEMKSLITGSIDSPDTLITGLKASADGLMEQVKNLEDTALAFQTGKDAEGSERLSGFIEYLYTLIRTCYQIAPVFDIELSAVEADGKNLDEEVRGLMDLMGETSSVMENNDIISMADILEYELLPALQRIRPLLDILLDKLSKL